MDIKFSYWPKFKGNADSTIKQFPVLEFVQDNWDDYGSKNLYTLWFRKGESDKEKIGQIKVISSEDSNYDERGFLKLDGVLDSFDHCYYSLGQDVEFYVSFLKLFPDEFQDILTKLRDVSFNGSLVDQIEDIERYRRSLIRYSEAEQALHKGYSILCGNGPASENYNFEFSCEIGKSKLNHVAYFSFDKDGPLNRSINVIIGENGTGKTQFMANLAMAMSGEDECGEFTRKRPPFTKVVALSYSAFDEFKVPNKGRNFSYSYCGIRDKQGIISEKTMSNLYRVACNKISSKGAVYFWKKVLSEVLPLNVLEYIHEELFINENYIDVAKNGKIGLSSGQGMLLYTFTNLIANVRKGSLILFDEPEVHLHPSAISKIIKMIDMVLERYESYAIIATHSPILLQDMPSSSVVLFQRDGDSPLIGRLGFESFGENVTNITNSVFKVSENTPQYKVLLKNLSRQHSFDEVIGFFDGRLSFNGEIYLKGCYSDEAN
ncbi:AAA family ATPase [Thalassolituus oleivorans]|uniref:AAA family ATPase n=1 Tax=Thalassolituus oleivorans TaxID=187493 RepID=UPI0023F54C51|nr:AAA family ATPase [Thalassolituus oleivorans]